MSDVQKGPLMTYEEIVEALRLADRLGDCVPENVEGTARAIVAGQTPNYHVVVYDTDGTVLDPTVPPSVESQINVMRVLALGPKGRGSTVVRHTVEAVTSGLRPEYVADAISVLIAAHVRYAPDPCSAEVISTPEQMILGAGPVDADEIATLVAAAALSIGLKSRFKVVGFKAPGIYTHVFAQVECPQGNWVDVHPVDVKRWEEVRDSVTTSRVFSIDEEPSP